jgi:hypothetical protein
LRPQLERDDKPVWKVISAIDKYRRNKRRHILPSISGTVSGGPCEGTVANCQLSEVSEGLPSNVSTLVRCGMQQNR